jgi:hypothetical protein
MQYAVIPLIFALITGIVGKYKGSSFVIWFLVGGLLPAIGLVGVILSRSERQDPRRECPNCGALVPIATQVCLRCGEDLDYPQELVAPRGYDIVDPDGADASPNGGLQADGFAAPPVD